MTEDISNSSCRVCGGDPPPPKEDPLPFCVDLAERAGVCDDCMWRFWEKNKILFSCKYEYLLTFTVEQADREEAFLTWLGDEIKAQILRTKRTGLTGRCEAIRRDSLRCPGWAARVVGGMKVCGNCGHRIQRAHDNGEELPMGCD